MDAALHFRMSNLSAMTSATLNAVARDEARAEIDVCLREIDACLRGLATGAVLVLRVNLARSRYLVQVAREGLSGGWINAGAYNGPPRMRSRFHKALDTAAFEYAAELLQQK